MIAMKLDRTAAIEGATTLAHALLYFASMVVWIGSIGSSWEPAINGFTASWRSAILDSVPAMANFGGILEETLKAAPIIAVVVVPATLATLLCAAAPVLVMARYDRVFFPGQTKNGDELSPAGAMLLFVAALAISIVMAGFMFRIGWL